MEYTSLIERVKNEGYRHANEDICSNFDHEINQELAEKMKEEKIYADYPGWDFHANVWFMDGKYHCLVSQYHQVVDHITDESFEKIKETVCSKYGDD